MTITCNVEKGRFQKTKIDRNACNSEVKCETLKLEVLQTNRLMRLTVKSTLKQWCQADI